MNEGTYTSGPFHVTKSALTIDGQEWLSLRLSLTQEAMLPVPDPAQRRQVELSAEKAVLALLLNELTKAMGDEEGEGG